MHGHIHVNIFIIFITVINVSVCVISESLMGDLERIYRRAGSRKLWSDILTSTQRYTKIHTDSTDKVLLHTYCFTRFLFHFNLDNLEKNLLSTNWALT